MAHFDTHQLSHMGTEFQRRWQEDKARREAALPSEKAPGMKAAVIAEWHNPPVFTVQDWPIAEPGPGELQVAVHTAAINFGDTLIASGRYQVQPVLPFVGGTECSGTVMAVGAGVAGFRPGDRIAANGFVGDSRRDRRILGTLAEQIVMPAANAVRLPDSVDLERGALFRSNAETSYYALQHGDLKAGETLLVLGAGGGTGLAAVQLGKWMGARVIASASSAEKRQLALDAGADAAIDSRAADWREQVTTLTGGNGLDMVYDPVGGEATERAFRALGWRGRLMVVGFAAGPIPALPANLALLKGASLIGANLLQAQKYEPDRTNANRQELMALFGAGKLTVPPVGARYPLDRAAEAYQRVAAGQTAGRIIVEIAPR